MRARSLPISRPMPLPLRARRKLIEVRPSSTCSPAAMLRSRECAPPTTGSGKHIRTPPSASTTPMTPVILTTTWSVIVSPVRSWTVVMVHAAAPTMSSTPPEPISNAELNIASFCLRVVLPSERLHAGMSTSESRGMETTSIRLRSPEMCTTKVVSERMPSSAPASSAFSSSR